MVRPAVTAPFLPDGSDQGRIHALEGAADRGGIRHFFLAQLGLPALQVNDRPVVKDGSDRTGINAFRFMLPEVSPQVGRVSAWP
jgi:hypothetical protein